MRNLIPYLTAYEIERVQNKYVFGWPMRWMSIATWPNGGVHRYFHTLIGTNPKYVHTLHMLLTYTHYAKFYKWHPRGTTGAPLIKTQVPNVHVLRQLCSDEYMLWINHIPSVAKVLFLVISALKQVDLRCVLLFDNVNTHDMQWQCFPPPPLIFCQEHTKGKSEHSTDFSFFLKVILPLS